MGGVGGRGEGRERKVETTDPRRKKDKRTTRTAEEEESITRNELKPLPAVALGLKSSEGFLLARHLTKQLEVNPFLQVRPFFSCESTSQN